MPVRRRGLRSRRPERVRDPLGGLEQRPRANVLTDGLAARPDHEPALSAVLLEHAGRLDHLAGERLARVGVGEREDPGAQ